MFYHAKEGTIAMDDTQMEYIRFGSGTKNLIMLPGLGDSLRSMKGTAIPMALMYRMFAKDFTVYVFGRKNKIHPGYSTREMAFDQVKAMDRLGMEKAHIFGVSMGGMIAQHLAIEFPERVEKLILAVTCARPNPVLTDSIDEWVALAKAGDHTAFMESNLRRIYSEGYYRKNKWMLPLLGAFTKPKSYDRLYVQAEACRNHNAWARLGVIKAPTLVVGGEQDRSLGGEPSVEIAGAIPCAQLRMYPEWGHGLYEEAPDFNELLLKFLKD